MEKDRITEDGRKSFITNTLGNDYIKSLTKIAVPVALCGTIIFFVLFGLTFVCHWQVVYNLFSLVSGFTMITIVYVLSVIWILDSFLLHKVCNKQPLYKATMVWGVCLITLGLAFMILTGRYKKQCQFDCTEWYVEESTQRYHWIKKCEEIKGDVYVTKGYKIKDKDLTLCVGCRQYMEELDSYYEPKRSRP